MSPSSEEQIAGIARKIFIAYEQLEEIIDQLKEPKNTGRMGNRIAKSYNRILGDCQNSFPNVDPNFAETIGHLERYNLVGDDDAYKQTNLCSRIQVDAKVLRGTVKAFLQMYLSSEDKRKTIGFRP